MNSTRRHKPSGTALPAWPGCPMSIKGRKNLGYPESSVEWVIALLEGQCGSSGELPSFEFPGQCWKVWSILDHHLFVDGLVGGSNR